MSIAIVMAAAASVSPPAPPITLDLSGRTRTPPEQELLVWSPATIACDGKNLSAGPGLREPAGMLVRSSFRIPDEITLRFAIDGEGRPYSIRWVDQKRPPFGSQDVMPSLAASRLADGSGRELCTITYRAKRSSLDEADPAQLARFGTTAGRGKLPRAGWQRISPGDCSDTPRARPLVRHYMDYREVPRVPGERPYVYLSYDIDADGVPVNIRTAVSSGHAPLDAAAEEAIAKSRFTGVEKTGCVRSFWGAVDAVPAPPKPEKASIQSDDAACNGEERWAVAPKRNYPSQYLRRGVEGWALLRYSVAPWGEIGEVEVLDAQPSEDFGSHAQNMLRGAKFKPQPTGLNGCIDIISFRLASEDSDDDTDETETE